MKGPQELLARKSDGWQIDGSVRVLEKARACEQASEKTREIQSARARASTRASEREQARESEPARERKWMASCDSESVGGQPGTEHT